MSLTILMPIGMSMMIFGALVALSVNEQYSETHTTDVIFLILVIGGWGMSIIGIIKWIKEQGSDNALLQEDSEK